MSKLKNNTTELESILTAVNELPNATGGGVSFTVDETLYLKNGVLGVNTAKEPDPDNTLPITSAAVANTVGNIEILLGTI